MFTVPIEAVTDWVNTNEHWLPVSVDFSCPFCGRHVNFSLANWRHDNGMAAMVCRTSCSGCSKNVRFWAIDPVRFGSVGKRECDELCMHPTPILKRETMPGLEKVPLGVGRSYVSAVNVLNAREWNATAVLVGRALEGLLKDKLPATDKSQTLNAMLLALPKELDLTATLTTLTDALRKGRNIGAHFDLNKEADEEMARMMVDLLEYFLEFLYILPGRVKDLHERI